MKLNELRVFKIDGPLVVRQTRRAGSKDLSFQEALFGTALITYLTHAIQVILNWKLIHQETFLTL